MKVVVWTAYGSPDVLQLHEVEKPVPKDNEVLIRIDATTVPLGDCEMRSLSGARWYTFPVRAYVGLRKPQRITILGMELAGEIGVDWRRGDALQGGIRFSRRRALSINLKKALKNQLSPKEIEIDQDPSELIDGGQQS